jgi:glycolate oxidase iron-sulfur subunit
METNFTPAQLADPEIASADKVLQTCVHYGFCTATCPTYVLSGDENESPRGRIDLIKAMLEEGGAPDPKTVKHIDQCLSCLACTTTCAAKVDYGTLVDIARHHIERHYRRPLAERIARGFIAHTLPYSTRTARLAKLAGLARRVRPALPRPMRSMLDLMPAQAVQPPAGDQLIPAEGKRIGKVALLTGCVQRVFDDEINQATIRVLNRAGFDVHVARKAECCGALPLHMGRKEQAAALAARAMAAWTEARPDAILVNASGCGTTIKEYEKLFAGTALATQASEVAGLTQDISEFLARQSLDFPDRKGLIVAYHDPCSLQHGQHIVDPPRKLLEQAGFRLRNIPEGHFCCGSAGTYNMLQPDIAATLGRRKAEKAESTSPDLIATGNLGCIVQLRHHAARPVVHMVQLLDWAMGGPVPTGLEAFRDAKAEETAPEPTEEAFW